MNVMPPKFKNMLNLKIRKASSQQLVSNSRELGLI